ncbi:polyphosphate kinase [Pseudoalteromonas sp. CO348]|uniref:polyphosphate kinase 2 family protein n=1 Tax=unclassified Pseudoalteromonas TaxID=194690 RepID=UPI001023AC9B|nr:MULTISPECIES: polyphosphate kinase [unclassified Pseudoalteromonas]MCG7539321.1 polyphosphate kinase [Pseudoalteromonas sp. OF7H-1]RZF99757.1 polyphosphate kinase [Pseudoalteromonas sp. CO348]
MTSYVSEIKALNRGLSVKPPITHPAIDSKKHYKSELKYWQTQLLHVQQAYFHQGKRAILVFEGWDAAGKGGAIRRMTEKLDPRGVKVYPIAKPTPEEQGRHYLYRFQTKLPPRGTMTIFDRSYYGRVLVERVEAFANEQEWHRAYQEINEFERLLTDDNVRIVKLFLHISEDEQLKRFTERLNNPYKRWKLTKEDIRNRQKRQDYEQAIDDMFAKTDTNLADWHLILAEHKWYARVQVMKTIVEALSKGVDISPPPIDKAVVKLAESQLGIVQRED